MPSPIRLRDLIRNIRACRTAAEEREVIQKECAEIRNGFRDEDPVFRCRNVAKLLYVHMLGFPAHFGQMEVMKLVVSPRFTDKRIGYLGSMLLLDENREVTMLITNSLKNDLDHASQYVVALALCTLGNICSAEMARDLGPDVERIMRNGPPYLKKKAILCACRIIRKEPEMIDNFINLIPSLLNDKNHGVMLAAVSLVTEICNISPAYTDKFRRTVPQLVRMLKQLIMSGFSAEHDVSGVADPFLQVRLLRLLRILGANDGNCSELMNDILAQVATNTETSKNVGNAILYETVLTIMGIKSESGLRVLAINILGRFLLSTDKNIRYVALNSLLKTVHTDMNAVQRHRSTILDCLKDPDPSILRRAVDLCFALINEQNVQGTMREILIFLEACPTDFKADVASNVVLVSAKYAPNAQWHIDTILKVLLKGGNSVPDSVIPILIHLISATTSLHRYTVTTLFDNVKLEMTNQPLNQVASWCIGEYADVLIQAGSTADDIVMTLDRVVQSHLSSSVTKSYAINAIAKLSNRVSPQNFHLVKEHVEKYGSSMILELQQRSVEFSALFAKHDNLRPGVLEKMPLFEKSEIEATYSQEELPAENEPQVQRTGPTSAMDDLLGLGDIGGGGVGGGDGAASMMATSTTQIAPPPQSALEDLLGGFGGGAPVAAPAPVIETAPVVQAIPALDAWKDDKVEVTFNFKRDGDVLTVDLVATNTTLADNIADFVFQAAVPKTLQLQLCPPSSGSIAPGGQVEQQIRVKNPQHIQLKMKLKIAYTVNGAAVNAAGMVGNFPTGAWQ